MYTKRAEVSFSENPRPTPRNKSIDHEWANARKIAEAWIKPRDLDMAQCL